MSTRRARPRGEQQRGEAELDELLALLRAPKQDRDNVRIRDLLAELKRENVGASVPLFAPLVDGCLSLINGESDAPQPLPPPPSPPAAARRSVSPRLRSRAASPTMQVTRASPPRPSASPARARPSSRRATPQRAAPSSAVSRKRTPDPRSLGLTVAWANNATTMQADRGRLAEEKEAIADERRRLQGAQGKWAARIEREREELRAIKAEQEAERKQFETERAKLNLKREQHDEQHRAAVMRIDVSLASPSRVQSVLSRAAYLRFPRAQLTGAPPTPTLSRSLPLSLPHPLFSTPG